MIVLMITNFSLLHSFWVCIQCVAGVYLCLCLLCRFCVHPRCVCVCVCEEVRIFCAFSDVPVQCVISSAALSCHCSPHCLRPAWSRFPSTPSVPSSSSVLPLFFSLPLAHPISEFHCTSASMVGIKIWTEQIIQDGLAHKNLIEYAFPFTAAHYQCICF